MRVSCGDGPGQLSSTFYYSNSSLSVSMTASRRASGLATLPFSSAATRVFLFYFSPTPAPTPPAPTPPAPTPKWNVRAAMAFDILLRWKCKVPGDT